MAFPTLLDVVKANGSDPLLGLIEEASVQHPEFTLMPSRTIPGITSKARVRTGLGRTSGSFRKANAGTTPIKHAYEERLYELSILAPVWQCDVAVASAYEGGAVAYLADEGAGIIEGELQGLLKQAVYGTNATHGNADGFPGFLQQYDATNMVVDAGGTTDTTASSVWLVRAAVNGVCWLWGNGGRFDVSGMPEPMKQLIADPNDSTKSLEAWVQSFTAWSACQIGSQKDICRIKKITADSTKTLTDAMISQALAKFPSGRGPNIAFMRQRSLAQLQASRTATSPSGTPAPWPQTLQGMRGEEIRIIVTDAIANTEVLAL